MKAKDLMTSAPLTCFPGTNLAAAAALMLDGDCGILPVIDDGKLVGVVTDRDLFIALATRNRRASDVTLSGRWSEAPVVQSCGPDDGCRGSAEHDAATSRPAGAGRRVRWRPFWGLCR